MLKIEIDKFINYLSFEKKYSFHTVRAYSKDLNDFHVFIQKESIKSFSAIKKQHIHQYLYLLSVKKYTNKTVSRKLAAIKSFFNFLIRKKILSYNIVKSVPSPKKEKKLPIFLTQDQISLLLKFSDEDNLRDNLILEIFYSTGIRISELIKIKKQDIDFNGNSINILGKGNKRRLVIFGNYAKKRLQDYLNYEGEEINNFLFPNLRESKNKHISEKTVFNIVKKYAFRVTQNEKISPHSLRHTFATHLLNNGADLMSVKELLGHEDLSSTQIYAHVNIEQMKKAFKKAHPHAK